ncbi:hypothetical protein AAVH_08160 [Aphelenchoides avenae]|nr:hypothetical protein AAVH_08160 [Aphelenchus avenae]
MSNARKTTKKPQQPSASLADDDITSLLTFDGPPAQTRPVGARLKKMLHAIRQQPSIYDPEHTLYGDAENRERVWSQLATELQMPDVRAHWNNCFIPAPRSGRLYIRDEQRRHLLWMFPFLQKDFERKQSNGKSTGSGPSDGESKTHLTNEEARREDIKRVVAAVEKHPCLYNPEHSDFGDEKCQSAAWTTISEEVDIPEPETLWRSIFKRKKGTVVVDEPLRNSFPWLATHADAAGRP